MLSAIVPKARNPINPTLSDQRKRSVGNGHQNTMRAEGTLQHLYVREVLGIEHLPNFKQKLRTRMRSLLNFLRSGVRNLNTCGGSPLRTPRSWACGERG